MHQLEFPNSTPIQNENQKTTRQYGSDEQQGIKKKTKLKSR